MTLCNPDPAIITAMPLRTAEIEIILSFDQGPFQDLGNHGPVVLSLLRYPIYAYHLPLKNVNHTVHPFGEREDIVIRSATTCNLPNVHGGFPQEI